MNVRQVTRLRARRRNAVSLSVSLSLSVYGVSLLLSSVYGGKVKSSIAENGISLGTAYAVMRGFTVKAKVVLTTRICILNNLICDREVQLCSSHAGVLVLGIYKPGFPTGELCVYTSHY
jgi:hypothetical protein